MAYDFTILRPTYIHLFETMEFKQGVARQAEKVAARLLSYLPRYLALQDQLNVPAAFLMCAHERESGGNWNTYLGNGEPLNRVTRLVPRGRGPFASFEEGAADAMAIQGMGKVPLQDWDPAGLAWWMERFNGFGYRMKGIVSPYLWGGTNHQQPGKYVADGVYDPTFMDPQLGGMAIYKAVLLQHPELALGGMATAPPPPPPLPPTLPPAEEPAPDLHPLRDLIIELLRKLGVVK